MPLTQAADLTCMQVWDPILIIAQIVSLQCLFYLSLGFWQALFLGERSRKARAHLPVRSCPERAGLEQAWLPDLTHAGRYVQRLTTLQLLSWQAFSFSTATGWLTILSNLINAVCGAVGIMWLVRVGCQLSRPALHLGAHRAASCCCAAVHLPDRSCADR